MDVFAVDGQYTLLGVCEKSPMIAPFFEEVSYCMPARHLPRPLASIQKNLFRGLTALRLRNGIAHCELIVSKTRQVLLDVGLRIGGTGLTHDLVFQSSGINLAKAALSQLIGLEPRQYIVPKKQDVCLLYLYQIGHGGKVSGMPSIPDNLKNEFVRKIDFVDKGKVLVGYPNYSCLPGYALFHIAGRDQKAYGKVDDLLGVCGKKMQIKYQAGSVGRK
jgi:hypothetical protein